MTMRTDDPCYGAQHCAAIERLGTRDFLAVGPGTPPYPRHYLRWSGGESREIAVSFEDQLATCETLVREWHGKAEERLAVSIMSHTLHPKLIEGKSETHRARIERDA